MSGAGGGAGRALRSMTGFGRGEVVDGDVHVLVDVRTVNHKGLDVKVRLPRELAPHELAALRVVQGRVQRGRVDVTCEIDERGGARVGVDLAAVVAAVGEVRRLAAQLGVPPGLSEGDLLRAALQLRGAAPVAVDRATAMFDALTSALDAVDQARAQEGAALRRILEERLGTIERLASELGVRASEAPQRAAERLRARLAVLSADLDAARLTQEIALLADRLDVTEEIDRLAVHVALGRRLLESAEASGRKLDFLCQELLREANTAGSKLQDAAATEIVVELKSEIERLREQAQNVE